MSDLLTLSVPGAGLRLDPRLGTLTSVWFETEGRKITPLHSAPWLDDALVQADPDLWPVERRLAGDFLCAPFGAPSEGGPLHGWTANSPWEVGEITQTGQGAMAQLTLMRPVQGARITKTLQLSAHDPLVYQTHTISGGDDGLTLAHHPMIHVSGAGWLSFSPKQLAITPENPLEPRRHRLTYPAQSADLSAFPGVAGPVDLHRTPRADQPGHEDFVTLVEAPGAKLGWTVLIREAEDDLIFVLKDPRVLPVTMLWMSNGGRDYTPWNGRHTGVIGIEDGCAAGAASVVAARSPNPVSDLGAATVLALTEGRIHTVRHVIGAVPRPEGWTRVTDLRADGASLRFTDARGATMVLSYSAGFFSR